MDGVEIPVRENLWWALHHLQLDDEPRVSWIDALCINQNNTEEKNYQVSRMDYIYHSASRCIAWIGKAEVGPELETDDCSLAMDFIITANIDQGKTKPPLNLSRQERREHDSLESLCRRKYWTRLWIIQEIALSKSVLVQCGSRSVPWTLLRYLFNNLRSCVHASYRFSITCSAPFRLSQAAIDKDERRFPLALPLADLTLKFKGSEYEDPRDAVFGLLGFTLLCCRDAVRADYLMTSEQLCNNLLLHHIAYHLVLEDTFIDSARTADIRDLCFAVTSTSRVTRELEHSIASLSMTARRSVWPIPAYSRTDWGRVILSLCANDLRNALRAPEAIEYRRYMSGTTSPAPTPPPNDAPVVDLRKTVTERLMGRAESWIAEHYRETADWEKQRESLATAKKVASRRQTHIFLTDTGYSGITTADTKIGDAAFSNGQFDLKVSFEGNHPQNNNPLKASNSQSGICVDAETTFQELLSWLE